MTGRWSCGLVLAPIWLLAATASADTIGPYQIDFNSAAYATPRTPSITRPTPLPGVSVTISSLDASLSARGNLWWDIVDGFGVCDTLLGSAYEDDEIEGEEVLGVRFSRPVTLLTFNVTDLYNEDPTEGATHEHPGPAMCPGGDCYLEHGVYSIDGGATWIGFAADYGQTRSTYGLQLIAVNALGIESLLLRSHGWFNDEHHDFSLAGVSVQQQVPEPAALALLGVGLVALSSRLRRSRRAR